MFRYIKELAPGTPRHTQVDRIVMVWRYESPTGMPAQLERERMDEVEDLLRPTVEGGRFATLVLVSTGENQREWIYYARSRQEFLAKLNTALQGRPRYPIELHIDHDPGWTSYEKFRASVRE